jgi:hypothetical protein
LSAELDRALDAWLTAGYVPGPFSAARLHPAAGWYFIKQDAPRLARVLAHLRGAADYPWCYLGEPSEMFTKASAFARGS